MRIPYDPDFDSPVRALREAISPILAFWFGAVVGALVASAAGIIILLLV